MIGVRVIVPDDAETALSSVLLDSKLLLGIDQKPVALGFATEIYQRDQVLRAGRIVPQVCNCRHFDDVLGLARRVSYEDPAALGRVLPFSVPAYCIEVRGLESQRHVENWKRKLETGNPSWILSPSLGFVPASLLQALSGPSTCAHTREDGMNTGFSTMQMSRAFSAAR